MLSRRLLDECYRALEGHDGVMPVLPMKDTVYYSQDGTRVDRLLDRSSIFAGQAPELYRMDLYYKANRSLWPDKILAINGSTEPAIMAGMDIVMIRGEESNYKITTDTDLKRFMEAADTI
jgi:2-C-methyl-D-erythritol 4-phosphate cytidylyltransferase